MRLFRKRESIINYVDNPNALSKEDAEKFITALTKSIAKDAIDNELASKRYRDELAKVVYNILSDNQKPLSYGLTRSVKEKLSFLIVEALNKK